MPDQAPGFDSQAIARIALELYGIDGEISSLVSYEDQNARIKTPEGSYVLKIANKRWPVASLEMQSEALQHLATTAPELKEAE